MNKKIKDCDLNLFAIDKLLQYVSSELVLSIGKIDDDNAYNEITDLNLQIYDFHKFVMKYKNKLKTSNE